MTEALALAIVPTAVQPSPFAAEVEQAVSVSGASATVAWRERHAAEVLWGLPPTVGGAVVRMHTSVGFLTDALECLMNEEPLAPKQGSESAASAIASVSSIAAEEISATIASGRAATQAAAQIAHVAVAACEHTVEEAEETHSTATDGATISDALCEHLQELLGTVCTLLDGSKQKLGAVHLMRDEGWVLNQLRLVRRTSPTLPTVVPLLRTYGWTKIVDVATNLQDSWDTTTAFCARADSAARTHRAQVEGLAESAELIAVLFDLGGQNSASATIPSDSEPTLSQQEDEHVTVSSRWRDDLGQCIDGWQKALKHARGTNWTAVQAWFATWNTRSSR